MSRQVVATGSRISALRLFRGMSQTELARLVGKTQATINMYESGKRNPGPAIGDLATALDCPLEFLVGSDLDIPALGAVSFRKRNSASSKLRHKARAAGAIAAGCISPSIRKKVKLPDLSLPDLSGKSPAAAAQILRAHWQLGQGPIANVVWLLEAKGIEVYFVETESKALDAFCCWSDSRPFVILNLAKLDGARGRYDAAHELGHLVLHQGLDFGEADIPDLESQANEFASEFLAPAESFFRESPAGFDVNAYSRLRTRWGMSIQALVRRSRDVGRISNWQYEAAFVKMSRWGWRGSPEPGCPQRETSYIHSRLFETLWERDVTPNRFAADIGLPIDVLYEMVPAARQVDSPVTVGDILGSKPWQ